MKQAYLLLVTLLLVGAAEAWPSGNFASKAQEAARNSSGKRKEETCAVSGMVVKLAGSEPIKSAVVRLRKADDQNQGYRALTDTAGHFELKGVEAGRYRLEVSRAGFVTQEFGQKTPNDPGALLTLSAGEEVRDRLFRLIPSAVIAGKIMDEDGQPLPWVRVSAMREVYIDGKHKLSMDTAAFTNDLGEYRIANLPAGSYYISVTPPPDFKNLIEAANAQEAIAQDQ